MNSHSFNYWLAPGTYMAPSNQANPWNISADLGKVASTEDSRGSPILDPFATPLHHQPYYPQTIDKPVQLGSYTMPMTPSDIGSDHDSSYCSPQAPQHTEPVFTPSISTAFTARAHTTSGRRRAQNRAAQRAFRERKEKHARDLEAQLCTLTEKYHKLELSHAKLNGAYEKLRKTIALLTQDDQIHHSVGGGGGGGKAVSNDACDVPARRKRGNADTLRKLLEILHDDFEGGSPGQDGGVKG